MYKYIPVTYLVMQPFSINSTQNNLYFQVGFLKEAAFYNHLIPEYIKIQKDHSLDPQDIFPKCYFASEIEILLEDLRQFNFIACKER